MQLFYLVLGSIFVVFLGHYFFGGPRIRRNGQLLKWVLLTSVDNGIVVSIIAPGRFSFVCYGLLASLHQFHFPLTFYLILIDCF